MGIVTAYENVNLTVLTCDAAVHTVNEVTSATDLKTIKMQGGGGTDFRPVFKWLEENKSQLKLLIFFTDGYGDFPKYATIKTLWVISKEGIKVEDVPFGEAVKVDNRREENV
jgi:predicted metal-dependent peptidase